MRLAKGGVAHIDLHIAHLQREAHHQHIDDTRDKYTNQRRKEWPIGCDRAERGTQKILLLFGHKQMEPLTGLEPVTYALRKRRSTN